MLNMPAKMDSALFPLTQLCVVLGIFAVCATVEAARKATIGRLENHRVLDSLCGKVSERVCKVLELIK